MAHVDISWKKIVAKSRVSQDKAYYYVYNWFDRKMVFHVNKTGKKFMSGKLKELDSLENFQTEIANGVVLVDFFATWCRPCQMQVPILTNIVAKLGDKVSILKIDTDKFSPLAQQFGVSSIPMLIVFKNGKVVESFTGLQEERTLATALSNHVATA